MLLAPTTITTSLSQSASATMLCRRKETKRKKRKEKKRKEKKRKEKKRKEKKRKEKKRKEKKRKFFALQGARPCSIFQTVMLTLDMPITSSSSSGSILPSLILKHDMFITGSYYGLLH